ncbi:hypothetical protein D3C80_1632950 [compost metagenome]
MKQGTLNHRFWRRIAIFLKQVILKRACVHPNTNRNAFFLAGLYYRFVSLAAADVAWINTYLINPVLNGQQRQTVIKMDIGNKRYMNTLLDFLYRISCFCIIYSHPYDLTARFLKSQYFCDGCFNIRGFRRTHALYNYLITAANRKITDFNRYRILS